MVMPTMVNVVSKAAKQVFVPLTVGGGVRTVQDAARLLNAGADKISVNSAAVNRIELLTELSIAYGSQATVLAIDTRKTGGRWVVYVHGGRQATSLEAVEWARIGQHAGAGEILLTSMDTDGVKGGFDVELVKAVCASTTVPVIASGGAGTAQHFVELFSTTEASAALAASIFHDRGTSVSAVKQALGQANIVVRPS